MVLVRKSSSQIFSCMNFFSSLSPTAPSCSTRPNYHPFISTMMRQTAKLAPVVAQGLSRVRRRHASGRVQGRLGMLCGISLSFGTFADICMKVDFYRLNVGRSPYCCAYFDADASLPRIHVNISQKTSNLV